MNALMHTPQPGKGIFRLLKPGDQLAVISFEGHESFRVQIRDLGLKPDGLRLAIDPEWTAVNDGSESWELVDYLECPDPIVGELEIVNVVPHKRITMMDNEGNQILMFVHRGAPGWISPFSIPQLRPRIPH